MIVQVFKIKVWNLKSNFVANCQPAEIKFCDKQMFRENLIEMSHKHISADVDFEMEKKKLAREKTSKAFFLSRLEQIPRWMFKAEVEHLKIFAQKVYALIKFETHFPYFPLPCKTFSCFAKSQLQEQLKRDDFRQHFRN